MTAQQEETQVGQQKADRPADETMRNLGLMKWLPTRAGDIALGTALVVESIIVLLVFGYVLRNSQDAFDQQASIDWTLPAGTTVEPGPPEFFYDATTRQLHHRGRMAADAKAKILELLKVDDEAEGDQSELIATYQAAVNRLAYESQQPKTLPALQLLALGSLAGLVGVMTRSMTSFIIHASVSTDLSVARWWPWYILRQPIGFTLGGILVVMVSSEVFVPTGGAGTSSLWWWLAISTLVGFASMEFAQRLRSMAKALFGMKLDDENEQRYEANRQTKQSK